jgi:hypothetical protein
MRQKTVGPRRRRRGRPESVPFDPGASARQVGLIETGTGAVHGPWAIVAAVVAAVSIAGIRAWWNANTRPPSDRR